jgi:hypothetical protein
MKILHEGFGYTFCIKHVLKNGDSSDVRGFVCEEREKQPFLGQVLRDLLGLTARLKRVQRVANA